MGPEQEVGVLVLLQSEERNTPKDEPEPAVKQGRHQRKEVGKERNHLCQHKRKDPESQVEQDPRTPAHQRVRGSVLVVSWEDLQEQELGRDVGVERTQEDDGGQGKGEGNFLVVANQRAKRWGGHVLVTHVDVDDGTGQGKHYELGQSHNIQRLLEIPGFLHLVNERWVRDLAHKSVDNVQERNHAVDIQRALQGDVVPRAAFVLDTGENHTQEHSDKHGGGGEVADERHRGESSWERHKEADCRRHHAKGHRADILGGVIVVGDGVEVLGTDKHVKRLDEGVVEQKGHSGSVPDGCGVAEQVLANITHTGEVRMGNAVLGDGETGVEHGKRDKHRDDEAGHQPEYRVQPGERHDGKTNVLREQEARHFLPGAVFVVDGDLARVDQFLQGQTQAIFLQINFAILFERWIASFG